VLLAELNSLEEDEFAARLGALFEHSPWVAERVWQKRPFRSIEELHRAMMAEVLEARFDEQLALVRAHPELAGREAAAAALTPESSSEQERLGFVSLSKEEFLKMAELNRSYRRKFGFPCIVALRLHQSRDSVMSEMRQRLANDATTELRSALGQIAHITRGRLDKLITEG
jgi:2-oxo-4-hydroxy-4-carboxy-5-ureidoimidazoline decarboxylase